jgi:hypothetical protein
MNEPEKEVPEIPFNEGLMKVDDKEVLSEMMREQNPEYNRTKPKKDFILNE